MQRKNKTHGSSVGSSPGKWAPLSRKAASGTWAGGLSQPPSLSWKSMCPFKCWCRDRNPNRTETHSCTYCMWGKFKNRNAWKPDNRVCKSCTPPKCESSGCPKAFLAFAFLNLPCIFYFWFLFVLHCVFAFAFFVHLWFCFLHFLSAVAFCLHFLDPFVCITCCIFSIFQFSKISHDKPTRRRHKGSDGFRMFSRAIKSALAPGWYGNIWCNITQHELSQPWRTPMNVLDVPRSIFENGNVFGDPRGRD